MSPTKLPLSDHVVRAVSWTRLRRDENDNVLGCLWHAFQLRPATKTEPAEEYLSTTWLEYFDESLGPRIKQVAQVMRDCAMKLTAKTGLAVANVGKLHDCAAQFGVRLRVLNEPDPKNPAYAAIRGFRHDDQELLEMIATDAVVETMMVSVIDALP